METSTKHYGTQNMFFSDYSSLTMRYSDSQSEDDCSLLSKKWLHWLLLEKLTKPTIKDLKKYINCTTQKPLVKYSIPYILCFHSDNLDTGIDFPTLTKEMGCLEGDLNIDKQFQSPPDAFGKSNKAIIVWPMYSYFTPWVVEVKSTEHNWMAFMN